MKEVEKAAMEYTFTTPSTIHEAFVAGAEWADSHPKNLWRKVDGDNLPPIDKTVIVLCDRFKDNMLEEGDFFVAFAHRYMSGSNNIEYWSIPGIKYWLDLDLPKEEKL